MNPNARIALFGYKLCMLKLSPPPPPPLFRDELSGLPASSATSERLVAFKRLSSSRASARSVASPRSRLASSAIARARGGAS